MEESRIQWNREETLEQLGGDQALLQEVMEIFLREAPLHLDALGVAVTQGNAAQIETVAHTMKGELGYLGVPEISRKARDLEAMGHAKNLSGAFSLFPLFQAEVCALFRSVRSSRATHGTEAQGAHDLY
jgi:HPt (histidine-containing phosphotransfer) domain-containing protein